MIVYRLEHPICHGPYRGDYQCLTEEQRNILEGMWEAHVNLWGVPVHHPTGNSDLLTDFIEMHENRDCTNYRYAFPDPDKLEEWFGHYLEHLIDMGFQIIEYDITDYPYLVGKSGKQVVFITEPKHNNDETIIKQTITPVEFPDGLHFTESELAEN